MISKVRQVFGDKHTSCEACFFCKNLELAFLDMSRGFSLSCTSEDMAFTWPEKAFLDVKERYNKIQLHHLGYINLVNDGITWCRISSHLIGLMFVFFFSESKSTSETLKQTTVFLCVGLHIFVKLKTPEKEHASPKCVVDTKPIILYYPLLSFTHSVISHAFFSSAGA